MKSRIGCERKKKYEDEIRERVERGRKKEEEMRKSGERELEQEKSRDGDWARGKEKGMGKGRDKHRASTRDDEREREREFKSNDRERMARRKLLHQLEPSSSKRKWKRSCIQLPVWRCAVPILQKPRLQNLNQP